MNEKSWVFIIFLAFFSVACSQENNASIELSGLNYTDTWITSFSVDDYEGHGIEPDGGGGAFVCCVKIPQKWYAGMKVTVRWTKDDRFPDLWKKQVVNVPEYTKQDISALAVHFYPGDIVKVLVTSKAARHPDYPYPRPK